MMNGANHNLDGISTYPFPIFGTGWETQMEKLINLPDRGYTVIGNDVWLRYDSTIMPGVKIGNGAIVAAKSVVIKDVPAYTIVGGNPAKPIKQRFSDEDIALLEDIAWWDWDLEKITRNLHLIMGNDIRALHHATWPSSVPREYPQSDSQTSQTQILRWFLDCPNGDAVG